MVPTKILSSTTAFNIDINKKCFLSRYKHIRMIPEGSCDTENWSNGCWKFSFASHEKNTF